MKIASMSPFFAIIILGVAVFAGHSSFNQKIDLSQWKSNQQILLLIENCEDGQMDMGSCKAKIPTVLDQCKSFHVLACDDNRLLDLLNSGNPQIGIR